MLKQGSQSDPGEQDSLTAFDLSTTRRCEFLFQTTETVEVRKIQPGEQNNLWAEINHGGVGIGGKALLGRA
ncbi:MAG: hypothetical protein SVX28_10325 [Pseudomonadota bacterium]|nr:hypothetical protein [Pseudomonadota bacterium]